MKRLLISFLILACSSADDPLTVDQTPNDMRMATDGTPPPGAQNPDSFTAVPDADPSNDAFAIDMSLDTGLPTIDMTVDAAVWDWTWANCRIAHMNDTLAHTDREKCDASFRAPPDTYVYGIHWIFLGHDQNTVDTYPESQLADLNQVFAPSEMSFFNVSRVRIENPIVTEGGRGRTTFPIGDAIADLAQHLNVDSSDPHIVLQAFIDRQRLVGAIGEQGEGGIMGREITLDTRVNSATYYKYIARLYPNLITVIVRNAQGEKSTASYPSRNFWGTKADVIFLTEAGTLSALPHEMGHFFGLVHTHGVWDRQPGATQSWNLNQLNGISDDAWDDLRAIAGDDYANDFSQTYLPYDAPEHALNAFETAQTTARKVLGWGELTYTNEFETVGSDARFLDHVLSGEPPLMKNFVRATEEGTFSGNNCGKSYIGEDRRTLRCKYGDGSNAPEHVLLADHPLVGDVLLFEDSTASNLMSYISTDVSDGVRRKVHLTPRQRQLIRFGAAMPSRQRLRNYARE